MPVAGGGAGGLIVLFEYQAADAASGEGVGGGCAGDATADNQHAFHKDRRRGNLPGFARVGLLRHGGAVLPIKLAKAILRQLGSRGSWQQINIALQRVGIGGNKVGSGGGATFQVPFIRIMEAT